MGERERENIQKGEWIKKVLETWKTMKKKEDRVGQRQTSVGARW